MITLAIIGVVAALTIPSVIKNYQRQQTGIKLKKAYTTLNQAINQSSIVNGNPSNWDYTLTNIDFFKKYIQPYLKVSIVCDRKDADTKCLKNGTKYLGHTTCNGTYCLNNSRYAVMLQDGISIFMYQKNNIAAEKEIGVDIDGAKGFNMIGKDVFYFRLLKPGDYSKTTINADGNKNVMKLNGKGKPILYPHGYGYDNAFLLTSGNGNHKGCYKTAPEAGHHCVFVIMKNNWKVPDKKEYKKLCPNCPESDYPW